MSNNLVSAQRIEDWWCDDIDSTMALRRNEVPKVDSNGDPVLVSDPDGSGNKVQAETATVQAREVASLTQTRTVIGLRFFRSAKGMKQSNFSFRTGPATRMSWSSTGWVCTRDSIKCVNSAIGEYLQTQTWEFYGSWSNVPNGYFG